MAEVVSSFELIFKPQSPADPDDGGPVATVIQGYFLSISNLEDEDYTYSLRFIAVDPGDPSRSLENNTVVIIDLPTDDNDFSRLRSVDGKRYFIDSGSITVPAHGTALVAVLPQVFGPVPGDDTPIAAPTFEVRGYVEISLPALFRRLEGDGPFGSLFLPQAQSDGPVQVVLTPQYRASYLDADGAITDQTQSTVPVGSGAGVTSIEPDPPFFRIPTTDFLPDFGLDLIERLDDREKASLLGGLLAGVDPDAGVKGLNKMLKAMGAPVSLKKDG